MPTFDTPQPVSLSIVLGVGHLRIVASDRTDTVVEVAPSDPANPSDVNAAARTSVEYANGQIEIKAPKGWRRNFGRGSESIEVRVEVPSGSELRGEGGVGDVRSTGRLGRCEYRIGAGDLTFEAVAGVTDVTTGTGAVKLERLGGSASVKNGNGDTWIGEVGGDLQVKAANGRIEVERAGAAVTAKSANGDIRLGEVSHGAVTATTACGKVEVGVCAGVAAWLDLHTGFGHVRNLLEPAERPGPSEDTVEVRARSSFGDITLHRTGPQPPPRRVGAVAHAGTGPAPTAP